MESPKAFTKIPIIDFGPFLNGTIEEKQKVAADIGDACRNVGFFYLKNHGIPEDLFERVLFQSKRFYSMPLEEKMKLVKTDENFVTGYNPLGREIVSRLGDYKEGFDFVYELPPDDELLKKDSAVLYSGNKWPENLPGFREVIYDEYLTTMIDLADKLMASYALALGIPQEYFAPMMKKRGVIARLAYYPSPPHEQSDDQLSCGVHTDQTGITLLAQLDGTSGLQVKNSLDEWIDAVPIPGTLVVNIGDLIERWSNGHFKATQHRVILRPGIDRYSAIAFTMPQYYTIIENCMKDEAPKYTPVIAGDFVLQRESLFYGEANKWVPHEENVENTENYFKTKDPAKSTSTENH